MHVTFMILVRVNPVVQYAFTAVDTDAGSVLLQLQHDTAQLKQMVHELQTAIHKHQSVPLVAFANECTSEVVSIGTCLISRETGLPKILIS